MGWKSLQGAAGTESCPNQNSSTVPMCLGRKCLDCLNLKYLTKDVSGGLSRMAKQDPERGLKDPPLSGKWERRQK